MLTVRWPPAGVRLVVTDRRGDLHPEACAGREADVMVTSNGPILVPEVVTPGAAHDFRVNAEDPDDRVRTKPGGTWQWVAWRRAGTAIGP